MHGWYAVHSAESSSGGEDIDTVGGVTTESEVRVRVFIHTNQYPTRMFQTYLQQAHARERLRNGESN